MAILEINWKPDAKKLRVFSVGWLVLFGILGVLVAHKHYGFSGEEKWIWSYVLWGVGGLVFLIGLVAPRAVYPFFLALTVVTFPIGWVVSNVVMALVYFGLFTPMALFFRLKHRDELHRAIEPGAMTYWRERPGAPPAKRYFQQF